MLNHIIFLMGELFIFFTWGGRLSFYFELVWHPDTWHLIAIKILSPRKCPWIPSSFLYGPLSSFLGPSFPPWPLSPLYGPFPHLPSPFLHGPSLNWLCPNLVPLALPHPIGFFCLSLARSLPSWPIYSIRSPFISFLVPLLSLAPSCPGPPPLPGPFLPWPLPIFSATSLPPLVPFFPPWLLTLLSWTLPSPHPWPFHSLPRLYPTLPCPLPSFHGSFLSPLNFHPSLPMAVCFLYKGNIKKTSNFKIWLYQQ